MRNLLLKISYCGRNYHGFQVQKNATSVQFVLQTKIEELVAHKIEIKGCSRTDAGAHALEYFVGFKTTSNIPCKNFVHALNSRLPRDIVVRSCREKPPDFHARYNAKAKEYTYKLLNCEIYDPLLDGLVYFYKYKLDCKKLDELAKAFVGQYDFRALSAKDDEKTSFVREIYYFDVSRSDDMVEFRTAGNGFLYKMVRIMVGTLLGFERRGKTADNILNLIESKERNNAGRTVPACGLYLSRVIY
ncbi:tRNA pseudouridine synthase A [Clostridia bacterium]|nr:tRNA pseudouridine synthase A [Clostridia bacterium]